MTAAADSPAVVARPVTREGEPTETVTPAKARPNKRVYLLGALAVAALGGGAFWLSQRGLESTDDAQVDAELVAIAPRVAGVVTKVAFEDNQNVKAGDVLVELDSEPAKARLQQAEANLEAARATASAADAEARLAETNAKAGNRVASASLSAASAGASSSRDQIAEARARVTAAEAGRAQAKSDYDRTSKLVESGALGAAQLESARTANDTAEASLAQARAHLAVLEGAAAQAGAHVAEASARAEQAKQVDVVIAQAQAKSRAANAQVAQLEAVRDLAKLELSYTRIVAPQDGVVSKKNIAVGQTVSVGSPFVQLLPAKPLWVTANFKETQLGHMKDGQPVDVEIDAFPGMKLHGKLESFSAATGARFALLPPDNATGNFTKVVQRVPVRVRFESLPSDVVLRPGMSAYVTVDTRK